VENIEHQNLWPGRLNMEEIGHVNNTKHPLYIVFRVTTLKKKTAELPGKTKKEINVKTWLDVIANSPSKHKFKLQTDLVLKSAQYEGV
jgi:hypothetical protein